MKIEINKKYKTRDGREVRIYATDMPGIYQVHGSFINKDKTWSVAVWTINGAFDIDVNLHDLDLIEVKEKKQLTGFVNVYKSNLSTHHRTKELADDYAKAIEIRIACIDLSQYEIFYEENEGL